MSILLELTAIYATLGFVGSDHVTHVLWLLKLWPREIDGWGLMLTGSDIRALSKSWWTMTWQGEHCTMWFVDTWLLLALRWWALLLGELGGDYWLEVELWVGCQPSGKCSSEAIERMARQSNEQVWATLTCIKDTLTTKGPPIIYVVISPLCLDKQLKSLARGACFSLASHPHEGGWRLHGGLDALGYIAQDPIILMVPVYIFCENGLHRLCPPSVVWKGSMLDLDGWYSNVLWMYIYVWCPTFFFCREKKCFPSVIPQHIYKDTVCTQFLLCNL